MKNITLWFLLFFCLPISSEVAANNLQEPKGNNPVIERALLEAEKSIRMVDFDKALDQLNIALDLARSIDHQRYIALASSILAQLHYVRSDFDKAATELQRAVSIQREIEDDEGLAYSYVNYAKIFIAKHNFERATEYLDLAQDIYRLLGDTESLGIIALNRGILALNTEADYQKAKRLFREAEEKLQDSTNKYELTRLQYYKGRANYVTGNYQQAIEEAEIGLAISEKEGFASMKKILINFISQNYEALGNYQRALSYLHKSNDIRDSIFNLNKEALASEATARYGVDALKSNLDELTRINEEQERTLKVNKLTTILSVALITILSLLTLSLYKNNNLRARANDLLQKKNSELIIAKENAEKASVAKAQFLSTITHELRTPLYAVTGLTHLLLEESPTPNQKEHLNSLKFSGEYLLALINNILDLNKLEAQKVEMLDTSFNLKKRISDVLIALKKSAADKKTELHLEFDKNIPKKLKGDPLKISQILINLVGNSIKFTEDGDVWVRVLKLSQNENTILLKFEVEDNGEGIGEEKQQSIFDNFTQGSLQINRKFGGTGLGLSIVKNLLNLMNSEIKLTSELGKGSKFFFELKFEALEPLTPTTVAGTAVPQKLPNNAIMHNKKILIVEDNKINQMITRKILEKHKVKCDVADDGNIAIEKTKSGDFDLILMDIHMPGISGIEATIEIRKFDPSIPIIALTAVTLDENLDQFFMNGFTDIIPKPYKIEEFFEKVNKYLSRKEKIT